MRLKRPKDVIMTRKKKIKEFSRHERFTAIIGGVALLLLVFSCIFGKNDTWIGILQGLSTGLLAGVILLFVTGIKNQELRELTDLFEKYHIIENNLISVTTAYSDFYHHTYHGKKKSMTSKQYLSYIHKVYQSYTSSWGELFILLMEFDEESELNKEIFELSNDLRFCTLYIGKRMHMLANTKDKKKRDFDKDLDLVSELYSIDEVINNTEDIVEQMYKSSLQTDFVIQDLREKERRIEEDRFHIMRSLV